MFFRLKKSGQRGYVQIVENKRDGAAVRQRVIANLGRADELAASGTLASLIASGAKLTDQVDYAARKGMDVAEVEHWLGRPTQPLLATRRPGSVIMSALCRRGPRRGRRNHDALRAGPR